MMYGGVYPTTTSNLRRMSETVSQVTDTLSGKPFDAARPSAGTFIDLFAGCGGFSLGLMNAGWKGAFAVERSPLAFETLQHNLLQPNGRHQFDWPEWLPQQAHEIGAFIVKYRKQLKALQGQVDLIVGGPPCQGFSFAGKREREDDRNELFLRYIRVVTLVRPKYLLLENVAGIQVAHGKKTRAQRKVRGRPPKPFSEKIRAGLERIGYEVRTTVLRACDYGVAQNRPRFIVVGIRKDQLADTQRFQPFQTLLDVRERFLAMKGLPAAKPVTASEAISDLTISGNGTRASTDSAGFKEIDYKGPLTAYQRMLNDACQRPNSLRLANHRPGTAKRFSEILNTCRKGFVLSAADRKRLGLKKHQTVVLNGDEPSHTLTTLPDDLLHYMEPRILTVRECARLQSFPDWFCFQGKYTTGGRMRKQEAPRYTQVGNAVPPMLSECLGELLREVEAGLAMCSIPDSPVSSDSNPEARCTDYGAIPYPMEVLAPGTTPNEVVLQAEPLACPDIGQLAA